MKFNLYFIVVLSICLTMLSLQSVEGMEIIDDIDGYKLLYEKSDVTDKGKNLHGHYEGKETNVDVFISSSKSFRLDGYDIIDYENHEIYHKEQNDMNGREQVYKWEYENGHILIMTWGGGAKVDISEIVSTYILEYPTIKKLRIPEENYVEEFPYKCTDSDNGSSYYNKGSVTTYYNSREDVSFDSCMSDKTLLELNCKQDNQKELEFYECQNACYNGACIKDDNRVEGPEIINFRLQGNYYVFETYHLYTDVLVDGVNVEFEKTEFGGSSSHTEYEVYCVPGNKLDLTSIDLNTAAKIGASIDISNTECEKQYRGNGEQCRYAYECGSGFCHDETCFEVCVGCMDEGNSCISVGSVIKNRYCDRSKEFLPVKLNYNVCFESYGCVSGSCKEGICVERTIFKKLSNWFSSLF